MHDDGGLDRLSRRSLAALGREYMLFGHLLNRAGLPPVHMKLGPQAREQIAIEEWMGASPIYTRRMQRAMGFEGDDVPTIFKGLQLDVGFAHQYMDVRYELESAERGFFWLQSCGALLELEPHGEAAVFSMCHTIEDPTFDATAVATNPRARCRPVHRPPRQPADRVPHCRWECVIDPAADPVREIPLTERVRRSRLASFAFAPPAAGGPGGWDDYRGAFDPDFQLEHLSHAALVRVCRELSVQNHLLVRSLMMAVAERGGTALAEQVGTAQWIGAGAVAAGRLRTALGIGGDDAAAIVKVLQFHPAFVPGYTRLGVEPCSADGARIWIDDCDALNEADRNGWLALLDAAPHPALDAMVQAVNPRARCVPTMPPGSARLAWDVVVDSGATPAVEPPEVGLVRSSRAGRFAFTAREFRS
ncbi:MAG: hypothetical protein ACREQL_07695 [Candidatus Binatia bacterium]